MVERASNGDIEAWAAVTTAMSPLVSRVSRRDRRGVGDWGPDGMVRSSWRVAEMGMPMWRPYPAGWEIEFGAMVRRSRLLKSADPGRAAPQEYRASVAPKRKTSHGLLSTLPHGLVAVTSGAGP